MFTAKGLANAAMKTARDLRNEDLETARLHLRSLVGRDPATLTPPQVAAAAIESVAENSTDSYIGPWLAFALFGLPGAFAHKAVNTLDSMIGYHGRYEYLGKAAARLDDFINLLLARLSAVLILFGGLLLGLPAGRGWRVMWRDHGKTESPNAGWTMGAMSGLLGVSLEKPGHYHLGKGFRETLPDDIRLAVRVGYGAAALGAAVAIGMLMARHALVG
jgi:adenosylcobinamide-phosphate synthase